VLTSGNWTIESNGRVTITNVTPSLRQPFTFQVYVDGDGNALELGVDATQATAGIAYLQTSGAVNSGDYALSGLGFSSLNGQPVWSAIGPIRLDASLNWSGSTSYNALGTGQYAQANLSGTSAPSSGLFMLTGLDVTNARADNYGFYPIDGSRVIAIEVDQNQLGTILIEKVTP
jgi:hypothetical protein